MESGIKANKGNLSEGVVEKGTQTGFEIEFVGRIWMQLGKT